MKLEKVTFHGSLADFPVSAMHEAIVEAVLSNNFFKTAQLRCKNYL